MNAVTTGTSAAIAHRSSRLRMHWSDRISKTISSIKPAAAMTFAVLMDSTALLPHARVCAANIVAITNTKVNVALGFVASIATKLNTRVGRVRLKVIPVNRSTTSPKRKSGNRKEDMSEHVSTICRAPLGKLQPKQMLATHFASNDKTAGTAQEDGAHHSRGWYSRTRTATISMPAFGITRHIPRVMTS